jgi:DNA segregation ATPase FtsK/SpoIIIE-like protein
MTDLKILEKKLQELEERLKKLESKITGTPDTSDREFMDALYQKAKVLVVKYNKASKIFLQKKLLIDFVRASRLLDELEKNGVIGPASDGEPRKILLKK